MNTSLLQPALQRIIQARDSISGRASRHCPKELLAAIEEGRQAIYLDRLSRWDGDFPGDKERGLLRFDYEKYLRDFPVPAKQRITLRGGPLDGCWYEESATYTCLTHGALAFPFTWPSGQFEWLYYYPCANAGDYWFQP